MGASSVTGTGHGDAGRLVLKDIASTSIVVSGITTAVENVIISPPTPNAVVVFQNPLPGGKDDYAILLTPRNGTSAFVSTVTEENGHVTGFTIFTDGECDVYYIVVKVGTRPVTL